MVSSTNGYFKEFIMLAKVQPKQENKVFNRERMEKAINSKVNTVPIGLSREQTRQLILSRAK